ncbi:MAG: hypothetical protein MUC91_06245 [Verrucomicrobia bacterium]|nr:hypothetical protein [Verrucomicrobiota bacterium]
MSTKLMGTLMILLVLWGGYRIFVYYKEVKERGWYQEQQASGKGVDPTQLAGMSYELNSSLSAAQSQGHAALKKWLDTYGRQIQDPRKAWIQLDYCQSVFRDNPQEARAVFASVRDRLKESSPVYPRMKQMEKSFN